MSFIPRLPLFAAALALLTLALAVVFLSGHPIPAAQAQTTPTTTTTVDYDSNDDRLIEISNLAQLNAIRWDLNGDGAVDAANSASYAAAFPNAAAGMGCPDGSDADTNPDPCLGYELKNALTFDTNGDGSVTVADSGGLYWNGGAGWTPMGDARRHTYTGQFQGRGKTISHLFINNSAALYVGLFGAVGRGGNVTGLGMEEVSIASSRPAVAGGIVGSNSGSITASYATGTITVNAGGATSGNTLAGGLVGHNALSGAVQASFAEVTVAASHSRTAAIAGGLAGQNDGNIRASYAAGAVSAVGVNRFTKAGGLAGNNGGTITASYARGRVTATGSGTVAGGLVGGVLRNGTATASYWDTTTSGQTASAGGTGQTSSALQRPTGYSGIYANWNLNLDSVTGGDSPWDFVSSDHYPILVYGTLNKSPQRDYDADNDRLLEVNNLAQLNAIRWDLNADGAVDAATNRASYTAAFPGAIVGMGCASGATAAACNGYELQRDLNFDTYGDGIAGAGDQFWNNGRGWIPIGGYFTGTFQGNGKTIANLYINQHNTWSIGYFGLFGVVGDTGVVDGINLRGVNIQVHRAPNVSTSLLDIGALTGVNQGTIAGSSATGRINLQNASCLAGGLVGRNIGGSITGSYAKVEIAGGAISVGGLVGYNGASIVSSYSSGVITSSSSNVGGLVGWNSLGTITAAYSRGLVNATGNGAQVGGLVGSNEGTITAAYSRSPVKATGDMTAVGGLVGQNWRRGGASQTTIITASYAAGPMVTNGTNPWVGGLVGRNGRLDKSRQVRANSQGAAVDSYWDTEVSGQSSSALGTGIRGTGPTAYTGIYANWNLNLDGVDGNDDPWHFASGQYPALKYGGLNVRDQH